MGFCWQTQESSGKGCLGRSLPTATTCHGFGSMILEFFAKTGQEGPNLCSVSGMEHKSHPWFMSFMAGTETSPGPQFSSLWSSDFILKNSEKLELFSLGLNKHDKNNLSCSEKVVRLAV